MLCSRRSYTKKHGSPFVLPLLLLILRVSVVFSSHHSSLLQYEVPPAIQLFLRWKSLQSFDLPCHPSLIFASSPTLLWVVAGRGVGLVCFVLNKNWHFMWSDCWTDIFVEHLTKSYFKIQSFSCLGHITQTLLRSVHLKAEWNRHRWYFPNVRNVTKRTHASLCYVSEEHAVFEHRYCIFVKL